MNVRIFDCSTYQSFIRNWIAAQPSNGRGQLTKLARTLSIHTSTLSQILRGSKALTIDQASAASDFFGFSELEAQFFMTLVLSERAGTPGLRTRLKTQLGNMKNQAADLVSVIPQDRPLTEEEKAIFYSNWYYTAIWAQTDIKGFQTREDLQQHFGLPRKLTNEVVSFLVSTGLCLEKSSRLKPGHSYTHLDQTSPLLSRHHANWRIEALKRHPTITTEEVCYTSPMTISSNDAGVVRKLVSELISQINQISRASIGEELRCLNIDWIKIEGKCSMNCPS